MQVFLDRLEMVFVEKLGQHGLFWQHQECCLTIWEM